MRSHHRRRRKILLRQSISTTFTDPTAVESTSQGSPYLQYHYQSPTEIQLQQQNYHIATTPQTKTPSVKLNSNLTQIIPTLRGRRGSTGATDKDVMLHVFGKKSTPVRQLTKT